MSGTELDPVILSSKNSDDRHNDSTTTALFSLGKALKCPILESRKWTEGATDVTLGPLLVPSSKSSISSSMPATDGIIDCLRNKSWQQVVAVIVHPDQTAGRSQSFGSRRGQRLPVNQSPLFQSSGVGLIVDGLSVLSIPSSNATGTSPSIAVSQSVHRTSGPRLANDVSPSAHQALPHHHQSADNDSGSETDVFRQISIKFHSPLRPFSSLTKQQQQQQQEQQQPLFTPAVGPASTRTPSPSFALSVPSSSSSSSQSSSDRSRNSSVPGM